MGDRVATGLGAAVDALVGDGLVGTDDVAQVREALARRGLGLVAVAEPERFGWPGHWIAVTSSSRAVVMFGVPSGPVSAPLAPEETIEQGFVVCAHDLVLDWRRERQRGTVVAIVIAPETAGPAVLIERGDCVAGAGVTGDRYANGEGTFASREGSGRNLTLVEAEVIELVGLTPEQARRNVVTHGIDLDSLIGQHFRIGPVECFGQRRAEPCAHLQRLVGPGTMRALVHRGGLRADVLTDGAFAVGDPIERSA